MGWSTRELAELAGTSLRSVRHYHDVGLLPEPERRSNGYKQYGVSHLVRLLRIKRLSDLGFSLPQIAELGEADEHPTEALRALDDDLAGQIRRLQQLRSELADILERSVPTDLPVDLAVASEVTLSAADRQFVAVMGRTLGEQGREAYAALLEVGDFDRAATAEFDDLTEDADDERRDDLASRIADQVVALARHDPRVMTLGTDSPGGVPRYVRTMNRAMEDLYTPAQIDVLHRMRRLFHARWDAASSSGSGPRGEPGGAAPEGPHHDDGGQHGQRRPHGDPGEAQPTGGVGQVEPVLHHEPGPEDRRDGQGGQIVGAEHGAVSAPGVLPAVEQVPHRAGEWAPEQ